MTLSGNHTAGGAAKAESSDPCTHEVGRLENSRERRSIGLPAPVLLEVLQSFHRTRLLIRCQDSENLGPDRGPKHSFISLDRGSVGTAIANHRLVKLVEINGFE